MKLIVIRHGETELNRENRLQGSRGPNLGLTAEGREAILTLREELLIVPEIIYASPLERTQETAHLINQRFRVTVLNAPELLERDFGSLSGKLRSEINQQLVEDDLEGHYDYRSYGGESVDDVRKRVQNFVEELKKRKERVVMLVTHRGVIRILYDLYPNAVNAENIVPGSKHIFDIN